jgi:phospholipase/carboxylesterase
MANGEPELIDSGPLLTELGLVHKVLEPSGPGPYQTVVMLHGRYGDEDAMWIFKKRTPATWLKIAPRALLAETGGGFSWVYQEYGVWPELPAFETAAMAVSHFLRALPRVYNADPEQIILMGFSQGAAVSYATAMQHPSIIKAIAGLVGFLPDACATPKNLAQLEDIPIFMAVGLQDPLIPYERSLGCADVLRQANARLEYHEYDTGHKLNAAGMRDLQAWMNHR